MKKKAINLFARLALLVLLCTAMAAVPAAAQSAGNTLDIHLKANGESNGVTLYQVAAITETGYEPEPDFADSGSDFSGLAHTEDSMKLAKSLSKWVTAHQVSGTQTQSTNAEGIAEFTLPDGLYLAVQTSGSYDMEPFLVRLPEADGAVSVSASPKSGGRRRSILEDTVTFLEEVPLAGLPKMGDLTDWLVPGGICLVSLGGVVLLLSKKRR